jgi:lipopolysaccharide export system protein LptA
MKSKTLDVYYDQEGDAADAKSAPPGAPGQQQIRRLEAKGGVIVTQKDQTATGEMGVFDMRANTVTLLGGVVITQGPQVIKGERLTVDLTSGVSHVEGGVGAVFHPNKARQDGKLGDARSGDGKPAEARAADTRPGDAKPDSGRGRDSGKPSAKSGQPLKLN